MDELDAENAALQCCEVQKYVFAELLVFRCFVFVVLSSRFDFRTLGRRGGELTGVGFKERVLSEEALGDALKGPFLYMEEAVGVEGI